MVGATRTTILAALLAVLMMVPVSNAEAAVLRDAVSLEPTPPTADAGTAHCTGLAPVQAHCATSFTATTSISTSIDGLFTGELVCLFRGPLNSSLLYRFEVVGGLVVTYSASGGLYAGAISLSCDAKGLFGAGGNLGGVGDFDVAVAYV